jgi:hypothetical protein
MNKSGSKLFFLNSFKKLTNVDVFALTNLFLFFWMCYAAYFDRFIHYRGKEYLWEFFVYGITIIVIILGAWRGLRQFCFPNWLLFFAQLGIMMHFAGGLAVFHESRLYDKIIFGIRYDKYVHVVNAALAGAFVNFFYVAKNLQAGWLKDFKIIFVVLGLGTLVEIVEYLVTLTVSVNGVGGYDNNMQDLISNLIGVSLLVVTMKIMGHHRSTRAH